MRISDDGLKLIQAWEGIEDGDPRTANLEPYICPARVYTVGYGTALTTPTGQLIDVDVFGAARARQLATEAMQRRFGKQAITMAEAHELLREDVQKYERAVEGVMGTGTVQCEFDAMVALCFNIGISAFRNSSVARLHRAGGANRRVGDISVSALIQRSKGRVATTNIQNAFIAWNKSNGRWMLGLARRRVSELMVYGGHDVDTALRMTQNARG